MKKKVEQSKNKECKKRYHKKVSYECFSACISIVDDSFILELYFFHFILELLALVLALHCHCGGNVKYGLFSRHLIQRKRQYGGWKNLTITTNF